MTWIFKNNIEKEFVPYEIALALKELGFDEPCFTWHWDDIGLYNGLEYGNHNKREHVVSAPTFSQAFRWFREEYTLYHDIKMFGDWDNPQFSYIVSGRTITNPAHMWHYESKYSYEEAEFECIKKLIEIVKREK
jgi:hypothetical protein